MTRVRRAFVTSALAFAVVATPPPLAAAGSCSISVTSVNFGTYNVFDLSDRTSTGSVVFRCSASTENITIGLSPGRSGTFSARVMTKAGESLPYNLYLNAAHTTIWGDGTGGTQVYINADPPAANVTVTIYGRIPSGADVSAGAYSDTVAATINF